MSYFLKKHFTYFVIFLSLILQLDAFSIQNENDSLQSVILSTTSDSVRVRALHRLYQIHDSVYFAFKALDLSKVSYKGNVSHNVGLG